MPSPKTFKDLIFAPTMPEAEYEKLCELVPQNIRSEGKPMQATLQFENGFGVSVISGFGSRSSPDRPYELAVFTFSPSEPGAWVLVYDTTVTDDVEGYLNEAAVTEFMLRVQALPPDPQAYSRAKLAQELLHQRMEKQACEWRASLTKKDPSPS